MKTIATPQPNISFFDKSLLNDAKTITDETVSIDIATPEPRDALERIKEKQDKEKIEKSLKRKKMEEQMEASRQQVLKNYNITPMV